MHRTVDDAHVDDDSPHINASTDTCQMNIDQVVFLAIFLSFISSCVSSNMTKRVEFHV